MSEWINEWIVNSRKDILGKDCIGITLSLES